MKKQADLNSDVQREIHTTRTNIEWTSPKTYPYNKKLMLSRCFSFSRRRGPPTSGKVTRMKNEEMYDTSRFINFVILVMVGLGYTSTYCILIVPGIWLTTERSPAPFQPNATTTIHHGVTDLTKFTPRKLTCAPKKGPFQRKVVFQPSIFRGHVSFRGEFVVENKA